MKTTHKHAAMIAEWINIYPSSDRRLNLTKEEADKYAGKERTACIKVEWEE